jgi:hypothetical protein
LVFQAASGAIKDKNRLHTVVQQFAHAIKEANDVSIVNVAVFTVLVALDKLVQPYRDIYEE